MGCFREIHPNSRITIVTQARETPRCLARSALFQPLSSINFLYSPALTVLFACPPELLGLFSEAYFNFKSAGRVRRSRAYRSKRSKSLYEMRSEIFTLKMNTLRNIFCLSRSSEEFIDFLLQLW